MYNPANPSVSDFLIYFTYSNQVNKNVNIKPKL